ncbi:MAG: hypothetical protein ABR573_07410 [Candidatus Dormibacteria bacterium]
MTAMATANPQRRASDNPAERRDSADMQLYAMPPGESLQRLRSDFVALDKMLGTMETGSFTGYLRVHAAEINGVVLLLRGAVVETLFDMAPVVVTGQRALGLVAAAVAEGGGEVDIVALSEEVVVGIYQLLTAPSLYENLFARFVDVPALLDHLGDSGLSGSLIVTNGQDQGVVLVRDGEVMSAYTAHSPNPEDAPEMLRRLCEDPATAIEVRTGPIPGDLAPLQLSAALALGGGGDLRSEVAAIAAAEGARPIPRRLGDSSTE